MAGGGEFEAKITPIVILSCMMAATGGLMFGYDIGVSGNVFMLQFPLLFEPSVPKIKTLICMFSLTQHDLARSKRIYLFDLIMGLIFP